MLGLILGPILEENFTRSMIISNGDLLIFFKEPISCGILVFSVVFTFLIIRMNKRIEGENQG
jgi:putative tricarboxylic transport membrane protein